ncbi:MAG TPA: flagellar hook capping FlgD N-terminal domain-containing protein [Ruminiclostridium sp.]
MATNGVSTNQTIEQIIESTKTTQDATRKTGGDLGKNDFLNLLVTQLRYQDPLEPVDDKAFIAQMAQFSALEQMQNMNGVLANSQAFNLIGKDVTASTTDPMTLEVKTVQGIVSTVKMSNGKTFLVINNQDIEAGNVIQVNDSIYNTNSNLSSYTNLIGYRVKGAVYDSNTSDVISLSGDVKAVQKGVSEDYAVMDNVSVNIAEVTGSTSTDPDFMKNYLDQRVNATTKADKQVNITIKDKDTGYKVPITATLQSYTIDESGNITAVLDDLYVSVYSVANIQKAPTGTTDTTTQE